MSVCSTEPQEDLFGTTVNVADYAYQVVPGKYYTFKHVAGSMAGKTGLLRKRQEDYELNPGHDDEVEE
jgi:hypothetical protein